MIEWLTNLWTKNKILFWLLIPLVIVAFVAKIMLSSNYEGAIEDVNTAQQNDSKLAEQQAAANGAAGVHKDNADKIENKINESNASSGDENWHKNK